MRLWLVHDEPFHILVFVRRAGEQGIHVDKGVLSQVHRQKLEGQSLALRELRDRDILQEVELLK